MKDINPDTEESGQSFFDMETLSKEEINLLIRLPYRIGYWMSLYDKRGGESSNKAELQALETMIISYTQDTCKSEFVQQIMEKTVRHRSEWSLWQQNIDSLPCEIEEAYKILARQLTVNEIGYFHRNLTEIAVIVAQAFREEYDNDDDSFTNQSAMASFPFIGVFFANKKGNSMEEIDSTHVNISEYEREALRILDKLSPETEA